MAELDWALASLEAPKSGKRKSEIDTSEIETKLDKEYVSMAVTDILIAEYSLG
jgi:hypothetical protein